MTPLVDLQHLSVVQILTQSPRRLVAPRSMNKRLRHPPAAADRAGRVLRGGDPGRRLISQISIFGVTADITPLVVMSIGLLCGSMPGAIAGFAIGLFVDSCCSRRSA